MVVNHSHEQKHSKALAEVGEFHLKKADSVQVFAVTMKADED